MNRIRQAGAKGMFGAALSLGLAKHPETVYESPVAADLIHDGAEAEKDAPPALVDIYINRQMRRAIGVTASSLFAAENSVPQAELIERIDAAYTAIEHRSNSTRTN